jgi:hypothetical protein
MHQSSLVAIHLCHTRVLCHHLCCTFAWACLDSSLHLCHVRRNQVVETLQDSNMPLLADIEHLNKLLADTRSDLAASQVPAQQTSWTLLQPLETS